MADAYASLGLLKHVPCPAGDKCTAFKCLFRHTWDEAAWPLPQSEKTGVGAALSSPSQGVPIGSVSAQEPPQKRVKVTEAPGNGSSHNKKALGEDATTNDAPTSTLKKDALYDPLSAPITIPNPRQSVSPPPLKRKLPNLSFSSTSTPPSEIATSGTPKSGAETSQKPSAGISTPDSQPSKLEPKKAPRKPESLNPRLLKKPPAGHEVRYKLLKLLHAEYARLNSELKKDANDEEAKLVLSDQALIWMALDEEQKIATEKPSIYSNVIKNRIMNYKRMSVPKWKDERSASKRAATKAGPQKKEPLGPPKVIETGLTPEQEVKILPRLLTPIDDLAMFNYVPTAPSLADIRKAHEAVEMSKGWEICDRCQKRFQVFPGRREIDGSLASGGSCTHHPGKTYFPERQYGDTSKQTKKYKCCGQAVGDSAGCTTTKSHVFKTSDPKRLAAVLNFEETPSNPLAPKDRAVCFDCEMGYTVKGLELIRLTATSWPTGEELLDVLVQPIGEILDLNSRYSGVWPEDLGNAVPWSAHSKPTQVAGQRKILQMVSSPIVARDLLFSLISPETPLIGHGLENDLNSVRVIHPTLIDTVLLYPHKRGGLPIRNGLKMLMDTCLNRQIQVEPQPGQLSGHDSAEDARAAGDLVRLKVKNEWFKMKVQGWTFVDGELVPPGGEGKGNGKGKGKDGLLSEDFLEDGEVA